MKYLTDFESLENINNQLSCIDTGDCRLFGRVEAYSCKNTEDDKRLKRHVDEKYPPEVPLEIGSWQSASSSGHSPNRHAGSPLNDRVTRKTFFYLLATLNAAFPDYDFSDLNPDSFSKVPSSHVVNTVNTTLLVHLGIDSAAHAVGAKIWAAIDEAISLSECEMYSFNPDGDSEPDAEEQGNLWSFYYFFTNRRQKRIVFFTARAVSCLAPMQPEEKNAIYLVDDTDRSVDDLRFDAEDQNTGLSFEQYTMGQLDVN
ncbi:RNA polymerase III-inhibiting protein maf1 [Geranomyces variabilis]|nr:Maf1 regulator-domain-containing protein [Geranomyces variabilis]KAJ3141806.1 RNA polymerase III-inhibiting protein maf1 [Geranomyces variabilis]KAJ3152539.1 RNA polymerase III-inhibiting protein maf1 [Geranomyces variabilis]KAJ3172461.1 RNA polymerase III-inhibiting protein maf1 [Geranomyces variabilis]